MKSSVLRNILRNNTDLKVLLIISLILTGITPFCPQFTKSKLFLEICSGLDVKIIEIEGGTEDNKGHAPTHQKQPTCSYCFASQMAELIPEQNVQIYKTVIFLNNNVFASDKYVYLPVTILDYKARAPPYKA